MTQDTQADATNTKRRFISRSAARLPLPLLVLSFGFFVFALLVSTRPETKPVENKELIWSVAATRVAYQSIVPEITVFGELRAKREVRLRALVSGEVVATGEKFNDGARVAKGDVLLRIDPFTYETRLAESEAQLKGAEATLTERRAAAQLAYQDLKRARQLFAKGAVSQKTLDDRKTDHTIKKARRDQQKSVVDRLAVQVKRARRDLQNATVTAPFDGYVTNIAAREGRVLSPNDQIGVLFDADHFEVIFNLSDDEYGRFLSRNTDIVGRPISVTWEIGGERIALKAEVMRVGAQISQSTRGVDVYADVQGLVPSNLRGGAFVTIRLKAAPVPDVMALPKDAIYPGNTAYRITGGRLEAVMLKDFIDDGRRILVRSGLSSGDEILLTRFNEAAPGVAVKVLDVR
jgi:RND family efflux transporter MFP subunit